jgi:hypothetical protein
MGEVIVQMKRVATNISAQGIMLSRDFLTVQKKPVKTDSQTRGGTPVSISEAA